MIESLRVLNFRCFEQASLLLGGEGRIFVGENAQGKTSLLEAVCVLLRLQSPRAKQGRLMIREGADGFGIAGRAWGRDLKVLGERTGLKLQVEGEEVKSRREYLDESGLVVWMGNEDLELVRGGGSERRRYLDFLAMQVDARYREHWGRYGRALASRNRVLKTRGANDAMVRSFTGILIEHGAAMIQLREELCAELGPVASEYQRVMSGRGEDLVVRYLDRSKGDLAGEFERVAEAETRRGVTLAGPHRDEVVLTIGGRSARDFGSEGQQRTAALALKLGQGDLLQKRGKKVPVYLIDDVFGELDPGRRNALMSCLPKEAQKLVTTTHLDWWERGSWIWRCRK